jgi:hypothetical protein
MIVALQTGIAQKTGKPDFRAMVPDFRALSFSPILGFDFVLLSFSLRAV